MSMVAKGWSISALAVELDMDRRTVASRLRNTPSCGTERGHPVWRLPDALAAIYRSGTPHPDPAPPEWCSVLSDVQPQWRGLVAGALAVVLRLPGYVYSAAIETGLSEDQADTLAGSITLAMVMRTEAEFVQAGVEPFASTPSGQVPWIHSAYLNWEPKGDHGDDAA